MKQESVSGIGRAVAASRAATLGLALLLALPAATATDVTTATVRALPPLGPGPVAPSPSAEAPGSELTPPGLRKCVRADGTAVFTDRRCDLLDATPEGQAAGEPPLPKAAPANSAQVLRVRTCARNQGDLLEGVRMALEARDPNRFAEFYHWNEMGNAEGYQLMGRLARFADHPLVDVQLVSSQERAALEAAPGTMAPPPAPSPAPRRAFDLLRVDQLRSNDALDTEVTWFHLRTNAGCWWLQF